MKPKLTYVAKNDFEPLIILSLPPKCLCYKCVSQGLASCGA